MTLRFSKKEIIILIITVALLVATILGSYFLYLSPKKEKLNTYESQLKTEKQLLDSLQAKQPTDIPTVESIAALQKKVPVKQQLELLILELEKAEVISDSLISNMSFSEAEIATPAPVTPPAQEQTESGEKAQEQPTDSTKTDPNAEATPEVKPIPTGIKKLTVTLSVTSPSYIEFMKFIDTLENLNRLVVVESVSFTGGSELTKLEDKQEDLAYSVTFSAFYMPTLDDLQDQLPELKPPAPSNKTNPFSSFPDILEEDELE